MLPSHEHDMCQPAGAPKPPAEASPSRVLRRSQAWLQSCKSGEHPWDGMGWDGMRRDETATSVCLPLKKAFSPMASPIRYCCPRSAHPNRGSAGRRTGTVLVRTRMSAQRLRTSQPGRSNAASVARSDCGSDMLHASRAGSMAAASQRASQKPSICSAG
ncbi:hypothetical protein V8C35DRAFT_16390 [Trichoderma chlorosporum]